MRGGNSEWDSRVGCGEGRGKEWGLEWCLGKMEKGEALWRQGLWLKKQHKKKDIKCGNRKKGREETSCRRERTAVV